MLLSKRLFTGLSASMLLFASCSKEDTTPTPTPLANTITDVVVKNDSYSTLESAVLKAKLETTLKGAGPFTVFAPDNAAFVASGITAAVLASLTETEVKNILLYHTLSGKVMAANIPAGRNATVVTAGGDSVFVTKNGNGVFINGVQVTQADIPADNGVIHGINRVLMPPKGDIVEVASAAGSDLDSLVKAVVVANNAPGGNPNLVNTLKTATLTVFAPTNAAFTQLLSALSLTNIDQIPVNILLAVLSYHLVDGRAFSNDLSNGNLSMFAGGTTVINLSNGTSGGPTITGNGNSGSKSNIVAVNIMARNGVVHKIDRVLLP